MSKRAEALAKAIDAIARDYDITAMASFAKALEAREADLTAHLIPTEGPTLLKDLVKLSEVEPHDQIIKANDPIYKLITNDLDRWYDGDSNAQWQDEVYDFIIEQRKNLKLLL
jgi:hypothetical protein